MNTPRTLVCLWNGRWSLLRPLAVRDLLRDPSVDVWDIIFSWGKTRGPDHSSEAQQMVHYFKSIWKPERLSEFHNILLEDESFDTEQNAICVKNLLNSTNQKIYLITSKLKLPRALDVFERHWFDVIGIAAEKIITENHSLSLRDLRKQQRKEEALYEHILEPIARLAMRIEFVRDLVSKITAQRLH